VETIRRDPAQLVMLALKYMGPNENSTLVRAMNGRVRISTAERDNDK
jgi:hypothetical protein